MAKATRYDLALEFGRAISEMRNDMRQVLMARIREQGWDISVELLEVMSLLWQRDGVNQQELADTIVKDKASMAYLIDCLQKRGWIRKEENATDRRSKLIFLTKEGKLLQIQLHPFVLEMYEQTMKDIKGAEIQEAIKLVKRIILNIEPIR